MKLNTTYIYTSVYIFIYFMNIYVLKNLPFAYYEFTLIIQKRQKEDFETLQMADDWVSYIIVLHMIFNYN